MKKILMILDFNLFIKYKYILYFFTIVIPLVFLSIFSYPKTELTIAVNVKTMQDLDENGKIRKEHWHDRNYILQEKLEKSIVLEPRINPKILGGLILDIDSYRFDDSVRTKILAFQYTMNGRHL